jgi:hypothetical protein
MCCWLVIRGEIQEAETPLAVRCSQVIEDAYYTEKEIYASDYRGVVPDLLQGLAVKIATRCSFFEALSLHPTVTMADQNHVLALALNASMAEESREWWFSVDPLYPGEHRCLVSYWMMQIILSSYQPNLRDGRTTGYKRWLYPGDLYRTLWLMQPNLKTKEDGSWFNKTKFVLADILESVM